MNLYLVKTSTIGNDEFFVAADSLAAAEHVCTEAGISKINKVELLSRSLLLQKK